MTTMPAPLWKRNVTRPTFDGGREQEKLSAGEEEEGRLHHSNEPSGRGVAAQCYRRTFAVVYCFPCLICLLFFVVVWWKTTEKQTEYPSRLLFPNLELRYADEQDEEPPNSTRRGLFLYATPDAENEDEEIRLSWKEDSFGVEVPPRGGWVHDHYSASGGHYEHIRWRPIRVFESDGFFAETEEGGNSGVFVWKDDNFLWELTYPGMTTRSEAQQIAQTIRAVSEREWFTAMPNATVIRSHGERVIREILTDVPRPQGYVAPTMTGRVADWDALAYRVYENIACAWIVRWQDALRAKDARASQEAEAALNSWSRWTFYNRSSHQLAATFAELMVSDRTRVANDGICGRYLGDDGKFYPISISRLRP